MTTVAELIEALRTQPQRLRVVTDGYEGGYCDIDLREMKEITIKVNVHHPIEKWWMGEHDDADSTERDLPIETALLLCCAALKGTGQ